MKVCKCRCNILSHFLPLLLLLLLPAKVDNEQVLKCDQVLAGFWHAYSRHRPLGYLGDYKLLTLLQFAATTQFGAAHIGSKRKPKLAGWLVTMAKMPLELHFCSWQLGRHSILQCGQILIVLEKESVLKIFSNHVTLF